MNYAVWGWATFRASCCLSFFDVKHILHLMCHHDDWLVSTMFHYSWLEVKWLPVNIHCIRAQQNLLSGHRQPLTLIFVSFLKLLYAWHDILKTTCGVTAQLCRLISVVYVIVLQPLWSCVWGIWLKVHLLPFQFVSNTNRLQGIGK